MIRDRNNIKWVSMMLPEHVKMAKELFHDLEKEEKPEMDEMRIEELEQVILKSYADSVPIAVTVWEDGFFTDCSGTVKKIDQIHLKMTLEEKSGFVRNIQFQYITDARSL
ncbi:YolD-like family protein [Metabacillus sp. GX 13764]|uniref:YolD-like family protein n=1 Tax=Metabacillus kandeliae TaxID=2900151 RepID=UPI001E4E86AD|nr:YolD-like family protein [Metabacillus kandeliae]MCD7034064.1 YolD-like family protein [Metabacillus kandeliae]